MDSAPSVSRIPPRNGRSWLRYSLFVSLALVVAVLLVALGSGFSQQSPANPPSNRLPPASQQFGDPAPAPSPDSGDAVAFIVDGAAMASEKLRETRLEKSDPADLSAAAKQAWRGYPRTSWPVGWYVARMTEKVRADSFVRNIYLNPDDVPIADEVVSQLDIVLQHFAAPAISRLYTETMLAATRDIDDTSLEWQPVTMTKVKTRSASGDLVEKEVLSMVSDGPSLVYRGSADGSLRGVPQNSLPTLRKIKEARYFFICEVGVGIIEWFRVLGLCPESAVPALHAEVYAEAELALR
jgi:hypothetical protein